MVDASLGNSTNVQHSPLAPATIYHQNIEETHDLHPPDEGRNQSKQHLTMNIGNKARTYTPTTKTLQRRNRRTSPSYHVLHAKLDYRHRKQQTYTPPMKTSQGRNTQMPPFSPCLPSNNRLCAKERNDVYPSDDDSSRKKHSNTTFKDVLIVDVFSTFFRKLLKLF